MHRLKMSALFRLTDNVAANLLNNSSINVDGLSAGFYILEMTTEEGLLLRKNFIKAAN